MQTGPGGSCSRGRACSPCKEVATAVGRPSRPGLDAAERVLAATAPPTSGNEEGSGPVAATGEAASQRRGCLSAVDVGEEPVESPEPYRQWRRRRPQNPRATGKAAGELPREEEGGRVA